MTSVWREDPVAAANNVNLDELYSYDGVYQLKHRDRGDINANHDAITSKNFAEDWTLDMTGNWPTFKQDTDGNGTWDLNQSRTHDVANEITQIAGSSTHVAHDRAGNMTKTPKPDNWSAHYDLTFDAWNRLVKVMDGTNTMATYAYDGRNFRVSKTVSGTTTHFYFNSNWQCLEERLGASTYANRQYLWGLRYVDDLLLRDRDADGNSGTGSLGLSGSGLEERLYSLQDPNWNVVGIANTSGTIQDRYCYDAYGRSTVLTGIFGSRGSSSYDWETRYTGRQIDKDTGFQDSRNRWYACYLGRWLSRDPIGFGGLHANLNLIVYASNNPARKVDPRGHDAIEDDPFNHNPGEVEVDIGPGGSLVPFTLKFDCIKPKAGTPCSPNDCPRLPANSMIGRQCKAALKSAMQNPRVTAALNYLKKYPKCLIPPIFCACCNKGCKGAIAWHFDSPGSIGICDRQDFGGIDLASYLIHELVHQLQKCKHDPRRDCRDTLRSEIEAYAAQGMSLEQAFQLAVQSACLASFDDRTNDCTVAEIKALAQDAVNWYYWVTTFPPVF